MWQTLLNEADIDDGMYRIYVVLESTSRGTFYSSLLALSLYELLEPHRVAFICAGSWTVMSVAWILQKLGGDAVNVCVEIGVSVCVSVFALGFGTECLRSN